MTTVLIYGEENPVLSVLALPRGTVDLLLVEAPGELFDFDYIAELQDAAKLALSSWGYLVIGPTLKSCLMSLACGGEEDEQQSKQ